MARSAAAGERRELARMSFALDPRLAADTLPVGDLELSRVLLMNDARYPWLILVPRRAGLAEIVDLDAVDRAILIEEVAAASAFVRALPHVDKLNVGALGNVVKQLHVHVLGRAVGDPAWPGPVWGAGEAWPYDSGAAEALVARAREALIGTARPAPKTA
jgi:diadenosine tetraphosphate (Ap4A) HIT family hydrolase